MEQEGGSHVLLTGKTTESTKDLATKIAKMAATAFKPVACPVNFRLVSYLAGPRTSPRIEPCQLSLMSH
jgi:hypothetical protein